MASSVALAALGAALVGEKCSTSTGMMSGLVCCDDAVPVVQDVKPLGARAAVEAGDHAVEENLLAGRRESGWRASHRVTPASACAERLGALQPGDDLLATPTVQGGFTSPQACSNGISILD